MAAILSCDVSGHEQVKKLIYSPKKCSICKKRCLFGLKIMIKCIACKSIMHKKCLANRSAGQMVNGANVEHRRICTATTAPVVTNQCSQPFDEDVSARADNVEVLLQVTAAAVDPSGVVPVEVLHISTPCRRQDEILRASIAVLQAAANVPTCNTALNGPGDSMIVVAPFAVTLRPIWTWSAMVSDRYSRLCVALTYDPAVGLDMRVVLHCVVLSTTPAATGQSRLLLLQLILSASAAPGLSWLLLELTVSDLAATGPFSSGWPVREQNLLSNEENKCKGHSGDGAMVVLPHSDRLGRSAVCATEPLYVARTILSQNAHTASSSTCVTAFECIQMVIRDKKNTDRKQHQAAAVVNVRKVEPDLFTFKSKLSKSDYLKLCEPWEFKKVRKNEAQRNVYSLTITNSTFKDFVI